MVFQTRENVLRKSLTYVTGMFKELYKTDFENAINYKEMKQIVNINTEILYSYNIFTLITNILNIATINYITSL